MSVLQRRIEVQPHHFSWLLGSFLVLCGIPAVQNGEYFYGILSIALAIHLFVVAWFRGRWCVPYFVVGLLIGPMFCPAIGHGPPGDTIREMSFLVAGGAMGLTIGLVYDWFESLRNDSEKPPNAAKVESKIDHEQP